MLLSRFLIVSGVLLLVSVPLVLLARRDQNDRLARNLVVAALVVGALCGVLAESSARLVRQCLEAGNPGCVDVGASGFQSLLIGVHVVVVGAMTYIVWRE